MTPEALTELNRKIAVMEASKAQEIQSQSWHGLCVSWEHCPDPVWDWRNFDYRVKPVEPQRVYKSSLAWIFFCQPIPDGTEFIEVTPEIRERLGL